MSFKAGRLFAVALVFCLLIQTKIAENSYASRRTKIAFTSMRDGNSEIYVMDGDGSNQRRVTVNPAGDRLPTWSPDGKKIAIVSTRNNGNKDHKQIWVIDADGKNPIRLTDGLVDSYPDWSPDGTKIVYDAHLDPEEHNIAPAGITVIGADGNNKRLLTKEGAHPSWSPDGKRIAFISGRNGKVAQLYVMDADGQNQMQLAHDFVHKRLPSWSHDGRRIAYLGNHLIWVMDSDGENQRQLTKIKTFGRPTWSPDNESIAFEDWDGARGTGIYLVDVTNGAVNVLQQVPGSWDLQPDWLYPGELSVSSEGSQITIWGKLKRLGANLR